MALFREAPKCAFCNKTIAKAIYADQDPHNPIYGDSFIRWDYEDHNCKEGEIWAKKIRKGLKEKGIDFKKRG